MSSCVLPVWLMHCTWEANQMLFAVNGDTGKCVGDLPVDGKRRALTCVAVALACAVLALLGCAVLYDEGDGLGGFVIGSVIFIALITLLVDSHFKGQMRSAVEASSASGSYSGEGLVVTERWRSEKSYLRKGKALDQLTAAE